MLCEGMKSMYTDTFIVDKNPLRMPWFSHKMHLHFLFEPTAGIHKFWIFFIVITDDSKVFQTCEMSKKLLCHSHKVFKRETLWMAIRGYEIPSMENNSIFPRNAGQKFSYAMSSLPCYGVNTPSDMWISEKEKRESFESMESEKFHRFTTKMNMWCSFFCNRTHHWDKRKYLHAHNKNRMFCMTKDFFHNYNSIPSALRTSCNLLSAYARAFSPHFWSISATYFGFFLSSARFSLAGLKYSHM